MEAETNKPNKTKRTGNTMNTQTEVRESFWESHPEFTNERRSRKRQNDYRCEIREAFCEHVDNLARSEAISENLASRVTL